MASSRKRTVELEFIVDDSQVGRKLSNIERNTGKTSRGFSNMALAVKAAVGSAAIAAVNKYVDDSVRAFSELEQAVGGTEAVFGDASGAVDDFAGNAAEKMGLSEAEFRVATTLIGGQLKRMTGDVELAADESVRLAGVAADLAATYGGTTKEAVEALGAAFRGEADPAERFNLNLKIGAQNAKAVELGLAASTSEVDEAARAQATLALITEQSADAQGQFAREQDTVAGQTQITNARMENHKAIVGETLQAYRTWGNVITLELSKAFAQFALDIQELTGSMNDGAVAIQRWEVNSGQAITSIDDLTGVMVGLQDKAQDITLWEDLFDDPRGDLADFRDNIGDVIGELDLTTDELLEAVEASDSLAQQWGLTDEQARELEETLRARLNESLNESRQNFGRAGGAAREFRDAQRDAEGATEDLTHALGLQAEEQLAMADPLFNVIKRTKELDEAQQAYTQALIDHGPRSEEARQAALDLAAAEGEHQAAVQQLSDEGVPAAIAAFQDMARDAGIAEETIRLIIDAIRDLNATEVTNPITRDGGGGGVRAFDTGGVVPGPKGSPQLILAHGGETVLPTHKQSPLDAFGEQFGSGNQPRPVTVAASGGGQPLAAFYGPVIGLENVERALQEILVKARRKGIAV